MYYVSFVFAFCVLYVSIVCHVYVYLGAFYGMYHLCIYDII